MASAHEDDEPGSSTATLHHMDSLHEENERLRKDLEDCRDQLFQLMRKGNDTPESEIKNAFKMIHSGIGSWIDEVCCEDTIEESFKANFKRKAQNKASFASLGLHSQCYSDITWLVDHLGKLRYCLHIVISLAISHFLTNEIFRKEKTEQWGNLYPHGILETDISRIVDLQGKMKDELHRDDSEISKWRGQTISAFLTFGEVKKQAEEASKRHLSTLKRNLEDWLGIQELPKPLSASLMESVILRATEALNMVCCSNKTYFIGSPPIPPGPVDQGAELFYIKDMMSWQGTPPHRIVDLVQCLYPGVIRMGESGQGDLLLVQPTWLGYEEAGHLPVRQPGHMQPASAIRPKYSRRQGETVKSKWTRRPLHTGSKSSWFARMVYSDWASGTNPRTGKPESSSRRGSSQQNPGEDHSSHEQLNAEGYYAYHTSDVQYSSYRPTHEGDSTANDEGSQYPVRHRRASTTPF